MDLGFLAAGIVAVNLLVFLGGCVLAVCRTFFEPGRHTTTPRINTLPAS